MVIRTRIRILAAAAVMVCLSLPALAQEGTSPLQPLIDFLSAQIDIDLKANVTAEPGPGAMVTERANDFEHITGERPRFTPNYMDLRAGSFYVLDAKPAQVFGPTNGSLLWAPTGPREVDPPGHPPFLTYTSALPKDGSQYGGGALLFQLRLHEPPPPEPGGTCDYTVWIHDSTRGAQFQNLPQFPLDPATASNLAFGLRLTPQEGGVPATFALALDEAGAFQPADTDVRAFVVGTTVVIAAPRGAVGELAAINYYADCSTEGGGIDPATSGGDQSGQVPTSLAAAGVIVVTETPVTARPTVAETTTTTRDATTPVTEATADPGPAISLWAPAAAAAALLGAVVYWLVARRRNPEKRALAAWQKAERALSRAELESMPALVASVETSAVVEELEHERIDLCRVWPPACLEDQADASEGLSSHDQHFRRMALGELWADYKEGKIGAEQVEARWREVNTPEFQSRMRESDEAYGKTLEQLESELAGARSARDLASARADSATSQLESARDDVAKARDTYLELSKTPPETVPPLSRMMAPCQPEPGSWVVAEGPPELLRVNVGFILTVGRFHGRDRNLERGERLVLEMEGLLQEVGLTDAMERARESAIHADWSDHEFHPGAYWFTSRGILRTEPGAEVMPPNGEPEPEARPVLEDQVLTRLPASLGEHAYTRVAGWMTGFDSLTMQRVFFHQLISSRPYTVWVCEDEGWKCRERVWRVEVGEPLRNQGEVRWFSTETAGSQAQFETEVNRVAWVATGIVTRDLRRLMRWRTKLSTGPCP